jgi:DNA-binding NarL/FixJ family response regulator
MRLHRVVLADDHGLVRELLREKLTLSSDFEVVEAVADADAALAAAVRHTPDVVVLDVDMPGRDAFEVARAIRTSMARTAVMFLSSHATDNFISMALAAGARGYVLKTAGTTEIAKAVRDVAAGGVAFAPEVQARLVIDRDGPRLAQGPETKLATLADREIEVLRYIAKGLSKKEIASIMVLSVKTVQNHTDRLMQKLAIHDRVELARFAIREGLVTA